MNSTTFETPFNAELFQRLLDYLRTVNVTQPEVKAYVNNTINFLAHALAPPQSFHEIDTYNAKLRALGEKSISAIEPIPGEVIREWLRSLWVGSELAAGAESLFAKPTGDVQRLLVESFGEKVQKLQNRVSDIQFGDDVLKLGRSIIDPLEEVGRGIALEILKECHAELDLAPKAIGVQNVENADTTKDESDLLWVAIEAVKAVGELHEKRGKTVVGMMWRLLKLRIRDNPGKPALDAYKQLRPMLSEYKIAGGDFLGDFTQWTHWRNAAFHKNGIELVPLGEPPHIIVRDRRPDGTLSYEKAFTLAETFGVFNRASAFLGSDGAYDVAIEALISEIEFRSVADAALEAEVSEGLTALRSLVESLNEPS